MSDHASDYDERNVDFSLIHGETREVYARFIDALHLADGDRLLDMGGGYGSLFFEIVRNLPGLAFEYHLLDNSKSQLQKASGLIDRDPGKFHNSHVSVTMFLQDAMNMDLPAGHYDKVVCKMFIHEIPDARQEQVFAGIQRVVKTGGLVALWMPDLDEASYDFFRNVIRKKDELASFASLAANRHFLTNQELHLHLGNSGFGSIEKLFTFDYDLNTSLRLEPEFGGETTKLAEWHRYIIGIAGKLPPEQRKKILVSVGEGNIHLRFKRAVFAAKKR